MKIVAGNLGGQIIQSRPNAKMRPTSEKVREALFDSLTAKYIPHLESATVLDLFAGSGALGIESLSRGAEKVIFNDHHLATVRDLKANLERLELSSKSEVICKGALDAIRWLQQRGDTFDLVFLDPPYRQDWMLASLSQLHNHPILKKGGLVIAEHDKREAISPSQGVWEIVNSRRYGDTQLTFLRAKEV